MTVNNLSLARDAKAQAANLKAANTIPPEPIWYTPGEKETSIPSGLNPGAGGAAPGPARPQPAPQPAPQPVPDVPNAAPPQPRPYTHGPTEAARQAATEAHRQHLNALEAKIRAANNKRLQARIENAYNSRNRVATQPVGDYANIQKVRTDNDRAKARSATLESRRHPKSSPAPMETRPPSPPVTPLRAAQRGRTLREEHTGAAAPPPLQRPPSSRAEDSFRDETPDRFRGPRSNEPRDDAQAGPSNEDRFPTPKRFKHHKKGEEEMNAMVKQSIRDKEDSLRPMPVFKDLPANLLRRAVYDGFRVEHEYGRFKLVQVGPLGGRRTGSYIKYPDWLKARMNEGVPEHIVHPNGSVPPPDSKARVRR